VIIVNQFRGTIKSHRKRQVEDHFVDNDRQKRAAITEIQSSLLESDKFDNTSSNSPPSPPLPSLPPSIAPLNSLPPNEFLQSDELKASSDIACKDKEITETNDCLIATVVVPKEVTSYVLKASTDMVCKDKEITKTNNCLTTVVVPKKVPSYILKAYSRFIPHVNKLEELNGLKFIGIVSGLKTDNNPYLWHQTDNPNSTIHERNHQKKFSYSVLRLDKFPKTNEQLKNNQDRWISFILHVSEMTEEEVEDIFGDEPVFQEVLQILKLDNMTSDKRQEYLHSEKIRRSEEDSNRSKFEKGRKIGLEINREISREIGRNITQKINCEIKRRRGINETIVAKEIVEPIIDEYFDQGFFKMDIEKHKSIVMDILKRYNSSIPYTAIKSREKWPDEIIEEFKKDITKLVEKNLVAKSLGLESKDGLTNEVLTLKTFNESIDGLTNEVLALKAFNGSINSLSSGLSTSSYGIKSTDKEHDFTMRPLTKLIHNFHQIGEIVKQLIPYR
jgi:hypothetical protein